jgi:hypothetical protein
MTAPVLTLLVAGSLQLSCPSARQEDLIQIVYEMTQTIEVLAPERLAAEKPPAVSSLAYTFDGRAAVALPASPLLVTYDWRSPVFFDLP